MIRVATPQDAAFLATLYGYYGENTAVSFEQVAPTAEEFAERIRTTLQTHPYLVYEEAGQASAVPIR